MKFIAMRPLLTTANQIKGELGLQMHFKICTFCRKYQLVKAERTKTVCSRDRPGRVP